VDGVDYAVGESHRNIMLNLISGVEMKEEYVHLITPFLRIPVRVFGVVHILDERP
jgi:hypothetical protein